MAAKTTAIQHRAPFISLWSRDDVRTAIADFLPTATIAVLPLVAKPLRAVQTPLLVTAIHRRGKTTIPNPQTRRALLYDALLVGEPQYFCEKWERGLEQWSEDSPDEYIVNVFPSHEGGFVRLRRRLGDDFGDHNKALTHHFRGENLLVTRLRVKMSFVDCELEGATGYASLCGPDVQSGDDEEVAQDDFMAGPMFNNDEGNAFSLLWLAGKRGNSSILIDAVTAETFYEVDALIHHESVTSGTGKVDISVNGLLVARDMEFFYRPLSTLHLYNYSTSTSKIGEIEVWYEKAAPNQVWSTGPRDRDDDDDDSGSEA
jgi:hypothetical protein